MTYCHPNRTLNRASVTFSQCERRVAPKNYTGLANRTSRRVEAMQARAYEQSK